MATMTLAGFKCFLMLVELGCDVRQLPVHRPAVLSIRQRGVTSRGPDVVVHVVRRLRRSEEKAN